METSAHFIWQDTKVIFRLLILSSRNPSSQLSDLNLLVLLSHPQFGEYRKFLELYMLHSFQQFGVYLVLTPILLFHGFYYQYTSQLIDRILHDLNNP